MNTFVRKALCGLLVGVGYYVGALIGLRLKFFPMPVSTLWPPNSILLAALLLAPKRSWLALVLAAFPAHMLAELQSGVPILMAVCWFITNTSQALLGGIGVRFFDSRARFDNLRSITIFVAFAVILAPFATSFLDAGFVQVIGWGESDYWSVWRMRFFSNVLTTLALVPVVVTLARGGLAGLGVGVRRRYFEAGLLTLGVVGVGAIAFGEGGVKTPVLLFAPLPLLLLASVRFGLGGVSASLLAVASVSVWSAMNGRGPLATMSRAEGVISLEVFLIAIALPLILLATLLNERRSIEQVLAENQQRYRDVVDSQTDLICRFLPDTTLTFVNEAYCRYFDCSGEELIGQQFLKTIPEDRRSEVVRHTASLFAAKARDRPFVYEGEVLRPDGQRRWQVWTSWVIPGPDGAVVEAQSVRRDITEQRLAEQALRDSEEALRRSRDQIQELAGRLLGAQEDERRRISRELHDDINQKLAAIAIAMSGLCRHMGSADAARGDLVRLQNRISALTDDIRRICHELHPAVLAHAGLAVALRAYCSEFCADTGIAIVIEVPDDALVVPDPAALCLYRVAQEALHNVAKHSGVREAYVGLRHDGNIVELAIRDAGVGFDHALVRAHSNGLGLISIEERLRLVQGTVEILTAPGCGVEVRARVPVENGPISAVKASNRSC
jgi:PAS domain S-box-containing protein